MTSGGVPEVALDTSVQLAEYPPGSSFGPRLLEDHEFVWILSGSAQWSVVDASGGSRRVTLQPGALLLARAGLVDQYQWDARQTSTHAYVHFRVVDRGPLPPEPWPDVRDLRTAPALAGLCRYLVDLSTVAGDLAQERTRQVLALLLDLFVRGPLPAADHDLPEPVWRSVEYVRQVWLPGVRLVPVSELAGAAGVSAGHLFRLYREHVGPGPARALELVRLARAAVALQRSNASLSQIARLTGFGDAYHLSRRFAATYGRPPGAFRREGAAADPLAPVRAPELLPFATALMTTAEV